jgi:hypothetical protein
MTLEFHFERLFEVEFYGLLVTKFIILICAKNIGMNLAEPIVRVKNKSLNENIYIYSKLNELRKNDFSEYVNNVYNPTIKREAWVNKITKKIYWLNKRSKTKDKMLYDSTEEEKKVNNKYCKKRNQLEYLRSDEYIDKNIAFLDVKFQYADPSVFDLSIDAKPKARNHSIVAKKESAKINAVLTGTIWMAITLSFWQVFTMNTDQEQFENQMVAFWNAVLDFMVNVGFVCSQLFAGVRAIYRIVDNNENRAYRNRNEILKAYLLKTNPNAQAIFDALAKELLKENE